VSEGFKRSDVIFLQRVRDKMRVMIYGGGAVGLGIASCLLKSGCTVEIIAREATVLALRQGGLARKGIFGEYKAGPESFKSYALLDELEETYYDYICVCTKSPDSATAAKDIAEHDLMSNETTKIVLFQNGWGNAEKFTEYFPKKRTYSGRVITGFVRPKENEVEITVHAEAIHIGSLFGGELPGVSALSEAINNGGIPCELTEDVGKDLWAKMLYNCALNPLGAILDVPYGILGERESTREIMDGIITEVFAVMNAAGYQTHYESAEHFRQVFYERLVPDTAEHRSSTLQDIAAKKRTEIDALNGAVIKLAAEYNINVPFNKTIYNIIKFIEEKG
jgi:2-dehydropantoate 2-reductase